MCLATMGRDTGKVVVIADQDALVGYPDDDAGELACAVDQCMTEWYLPSRLEIVETLPRNNNGKVRKELLRRWVRGDAALTD